jgi:MtaA/CmuA family methyltransferase
MNSYERYRAMLKGEPVDVVPRLPILMQFAAHQVGASYGQFAADHRVLVAANLRCIERFGFDQLSAISDPYRETAGFGGTITFPDAGPRCEHPPLAESFDLARLAKPDPFAGRMLDRLEAIRAFKAAAHQRYSILGWVEGPAAEAANLRGVENFLVDLMEDELEPVAQLMDLAVEHAIRFAAAQLEAGADTIGIGDAICSQISPSLYHSLILPRQRRLVDGIHAAGGLVRLHICGRITHLLRGIATLGVDILDVDHQVSLEQARQVLGPSVALMGNLDPVSVLLQSTPDAIRAGVRACLRAAGRPCFIGAGCEIPLGTPEANLLALCEPLPAAEL